jgi:uncharacterized damage-inducible protein DinB
MSLIALTCDELFDDFEATAERWRRFFSLHPAALALPCDISGSTNVGELVWHIFAVSLRLSQRLLVEPVNPFDQSRVSDLDSLMSIEKEAAKNLELFLGAATAESLDDMLEFTIRGGVVVRCTRRKLFVHIAVHAIRHWAQIATLLRQNHLPPDWPTDFLSSPSMV